VQPSHIGVVVEHHADHAARSRTESQLPAQEGVFAPDYAPEEIAEIARKLRQAAGLPDEPTGIVANDTNGVAGKVKDVIEGAKDAVS
jgi:Mn-containing catalase